MSVDVDGNKLSILNTINFGMCGFYCMVIEFPAENPNKEKIIRLLNKNHYQVLFEKDVGFRVLISSSFIKISKKIN